MFLLICGTCLFIQVFSVSSSVVFALQKSYLFLQTLNTEGEIGINSQRRKQAHLVKAFSTETVPPSQKLLSPTPPLFPTLTAMGEKPTVMKRILTVRISQRPTARTSVPFRENVPQSSRSSSQTCT